MVVSADDPKFSGGDFVLESALVVEGHGRLCFGVKVGRLAIYLFIFPGILSLNTAYQLRRNPPTL